MTRFGLPLTTAAEAKAGAIRSNASSSRATPPSAVEEIVRALRAYFAGERVEFNDVPLDLGQQDAFFTKVYRLVQDIPWGTTETYGTIARRLGAPAQAAREVGQAMASNRVPLIIPCHRVTAAGGRLGGFSAPGGSEVKARMLAMEGVLLGETRLAEPPAQIGFAF